MHKEEGTMNVITLTGLIIAAIAGLTALNHHQVLGGVNATYLTIIFYLSLNMLICLWELCLFSRIDHITRRNEEFRKRFPNNKSQPVLDFLFSKVTFGNVLSPTFWADVWSTYSLFDGSYADRRTLGFGLDIGNGMSTLIPCLILHFGYTYHYLPANVLGIIGLMIFYQATYCTALYWVSFVVNKRHRLISFKENMIYIVGTNCPWFLFGAFGIYVSVRLILENNFAVFGN
jgi:hypothetical protein